MSLKPGGSWTLSYSMGHDGLPDDVTIGDVFFRISLRGRHWSGGIGVIWRPMRVEVRLRSWLTGGGYEHLSNPLNLVVPASNKIRFTVVG